MTENPRFRVLIAGGGVAGLLLANALERGGIDYILLERRDTLAAHSGAAICILPNGCRILDQLGFYDAFLETTVPMNWIYDRDNKGVPIGPTPDSPQLGFARTGYMFVFNDRRALLQIMVNGIEDKSKLLMNKALVDVTHSAAGVTVQCHDGTAYSGDILVGADGVSSKTREALWKLAAEEHPDKVKKDTEALTAEFQCLFGICSKVDGMEIGKGEYGYDSDRSSLAVAVKNGRTYYFIFQKMDKTYRGTDMPHYSRNEVEEFARAHFDMKIRPDVTFEAMWKNTLAANLVVLEEATFEVWAHGRIACIGDSIHKMTPNIGFGGNTAIESAAALANVIKEMADKPSDRGCPSEFQIKEGFAAYQSKRKPRADSIVKRSAEITRLQALQRFSQRAMVRYAFPYLGDYLANMQAERFVGAELISFLPIPRRSVSATMPFNPTQGDCREESKLRRAALALPFLLLFYLAKTLMDPAPFIPWATEILHHKTVPWSDAPVMTRFYHLEWLDELLGPLMVFFSPVLSGIDPKLSAQAFLFLADYGIVLAIWLIESARRANVFTPARLPVIFALAGQFVGVGVVSPLYYFLHYVLVPIENFKASDMRLTSTSYTRSVLPATAAAYYIPLYASFFWPSFAGRVSWNFLWQLFPIWTVLLASLMASCQSPNTEREDRLRNVRKDLPFIRTTVGALAAHSGVVWLYYAWYKAGFDARAVSELVLPPMHSPQRAKDLLTFAGEFLRFDSAFLFGNTFLWLGYLFWDIKHAGMLKMGWGWIVVYAAAAVVVLGPGATTGMGFLWREELIATRRHWAAVTEEKAREWNLRLGHEWAEDKTSGLADGTVKSQK
ncbi:hypothetical protein QBC42DRAFT_103460 [Cladorrhinum samala]|uniref:FAD-binding domain-containing protein n=1 Tax=Cladorrhinum samala TaxID=585594 RepID=A0AAV9I0R3_9PEZI|nr:hypothetical protein QBC42DRAFT_103460 [Cladorrhinum samala]